MNKISKVIITTAIIVVASFFGMIGGDFGRALSNNVARKNITDKVDKSLTEMAKNANKRLPIMLDEYTSFDSMMASPGRKVTYIYTLVSASSSEISESDLNASLGEKIKNRVCTSKDMHDLVKNKVEMTYRYKDKDGRLIGEIKVKTAECS